MRNGHVLLIAFLIALMFVLTVGYAEAGSSVDPEVIDEGEPDAAGDDDEDDDDIEWAWFDGENGTQLNCTLEIYTLPPVQTNMQTLEYEVYFSVGEANWVVVSIFNFGTGWTQAGYELRTVTYDENGSVSSESDAQNIDGDWDSNAGTITYFVVKGDVGLAPAGMITKPWAAVWRTPYGGTREQGDTAQSYLMPGRNYSVAGIDFGVLSLNDTVAPGEEATFVIELNNPGTMDINVTCNQTYDPGLWPQTVAVDADTKMDPEFIFLVASEDMESVVVIIDIPDDPVTSETINGFTSDTFSFMFYYDLEENMTVSQEITMNIMIDTDPDGPDNGDGDGDDDDDGWLPGFEAVLIALAVPAAVILVRRRR